MRIVHVINNNLVLAVNDAGREAVLTGPGLGYQAHPGQVADPSRVVRTFVPSDGQAPAHIAQLLAELQPEHLELVSLALGDAGLDRLATNPTLVIALADHVSFALQRAASGTELEYPLVAEVHSLYPEEYAQARTVLAAVNARSHSELPEAEAVAIALHLVNAGFLTGDLSHTYTMTGLIRQMLVVIEQTFGVQLDPGGVGVGRFVLHLRYLFVRIREHKQFDQKHSAIGVAIRSAYPRCVECALRIAGLLEMRLGASITDDEVSYLALHVARVGAGRE
jgi:beta-glucoside operon transcriptional antiterminator